MNCTRRDHSMVLMIVLAASMLVPVMATAQTKLSDRELQRRGVQAYGQLPESLGLDHAPLFAETVGYLFAYEQRLYRNGRQPSGDLTEAMDWLSQSLSVFSIGKGDVASRFRDERFLRGKGLDAYADVQESVDGGRIWNLEAYISSWANLYTYLQVAASPNKRARRAFRWLQQRRDRLIRGGVKGDFARDLDAWVPSSPKPRLRLRGTTAGGLIRGRKNQSKCLHKKYGHWKNGNPIHVWDCNAGSSRMKSWIYEMKTGYIRSATNPDKCLHKKWNNWQNGNPVHLWDCAAGSTAMKTWNVEPVSGLIQGRENPHKCIHKQFNHWKNGNPIHLWDCKAGGPLNKAWDVSAMVVQLDR